MPELYTHSRLALLRRCPRAHWYRYERRLAPLTTAKPLRMGAAFHRGLELWNLGATAAAAIGQAIDGIDEPYERETVHQLLAGWFWRYRDNDWKVVATEQVFQIRLRKRGPLIPGKIDGIVHMADGRLAVLEYKTAGESVEPDSAYWLRLRGDSQISLYMLAARALGYDVQTVLYDVTRKPTIAPLMATPEENRKYTKDGRLYANQREVDETPGEFGRRLLTDIGERPDYYYQRREVPRTDDELARTATEIDWQIKQANALRRAGTWWRNVDRWTCANCAFSGPCLGGVPDDEVPSGFEVVDDPHPELRDANGDGE